MITKESLASSQHWEPDNGAHLGPKTDRDYLGRYSLKTFETAEGKKEKWCRPELNPGPLA